MARTGLDFNVVAAAAAKISERGERVTLRSVRAEIGEGSLTTIQRHLSDWQGSRERKQTAKVDAGLELPAKIVEAIQAEITAAVDAVAEELRGQLADALADRDALAAEVERLREQCDEAIQYASKEQGKNEILQAQITTMTKLKNEAEQEARNEKNRAEACTARLEAAARELDSLKASNKEMKEETKQAREKAAELHGLLAGCKAERESLARKLEQVAKELDDTKNAASKVEGKAEQLNIQNDMYIEKIKNLNDEIEANKNEFKDIQNALKMTEKAYELSQEGRRADQSKIDLINKTALQYKTDANESWKKVRELEVKIKGMEVKQRPIRKQGNKTEE